MKISSFCRLVLSTLLLMMAHSAWAQCSATQPNFNFGAVRSSDNGARGDILATNNQSITFTCSAATIAGPEGTGQRISDIVFQLFPLNTLADASGVYATNVSGVGIRFTETNTGAVLLGRGVTTPAGGTNSFCWRYMPQNGGCATLPPGLCTLPGSCTLNLKAELVRTGNVTGGTMSGNQLSSSYYAPGATGSFETGKGSVSAVVTVSKTTCRLILINNSVDLGSVRSSDLNNNARSAPVPFSIGITRCTDVPRNVTYSMRPATDQIGGPSAGKMKSSTLAGVGIEVKDATGTPVNWDVDNPVPPAVNDYARGAVLRFTASMFKYSSTAQAGSVGGFIAFSINYN
ncbi:hypothetical protein PQR63_02285 [Herbaspirillum rhizosphaerae]|uniref:Fimbrial-type adhesion domain-containing protein n=1 Tax=Herbaspirillum rhizosphaerae TaxID=346179 RepID=A0ABW8Z2A5_9BURK